MAFLDQGLLEHTLLPANLRRYASDPRTMIVQPLRFLLDRVWNLKKFEEGPVTFVLKNCRIG